MLPGIEDNDYIDGRGQVKPSSRSLCQIRETCATRFRSILCDVRINVELMDGDRSQHHPDQFIKLE